MSDDSDDTDDTDPTDEEYEHWLNELGKWHAAEHERMLVDYAESLRREAEQLEQRRLWLDRQELYARREAAEVRNWERNLAVRRAELTTIAQSN